MTAPAYLLVGEPFLADEALDKLRDKEGLDPLNEIAFDGGDVETAELIESLQTPSLLGGRRGVVVRDAQDLKKEHAEALGQYLESPSDSAILVLVSSGRTKADAVMKKLGNVISLDPPKGRALAGWVRERARAHRLTIDDRGSWALIDSVGTELRDLEGALSQLETALGPGSKVGPPDIRRAFPRLADERIFAFTDAVGERRLPAAMTALRRLLDQGDEPIVVFGSLAAHIRRLLRARRHADSGTRAVADAMGMPEWRAKRLQSQARSYREEELVEAMQMLAQTDLEMKGDFPSPEAALERAVIRIVTQQG